MVKNVKEPFKYFIDTFNYIYNNNHIFRKVLLFFNAKLNNMYKNQCNTYSYIGVIILYTLFIETARSSLLWLLKQSFFLKRWSLRVMSLIHRFARGYNRTLYLEIARVTCWQDFELVDACSLSIIIYFVTIGDNPSWKERI